MLQVIVQILFVVIIIAAIAAYFYKRRKKLERMDIEDKLGW